MKGSDKEFRVNKQFLKFKNKNVLLTLKNNEETRGKLISIDNYLNTVLQTEEGLQFIKGTKIAFIAME
ncbi:MULTISPECIES: LSM domain-containing protein [Methanothermobacter]|uniref:Sm domain-containing protein n=3 Tax=Methanothermobacter TaxID=145260 RepID=O27489_METTH|nr:MULTISPECIES: LSM domain-containing protein [Methanothermobacter]MBC7110975.1 LSM domain protein [Methanothermobacter sp.]AAB85915.1 unknown [Methanothermobacter thermautotrophicus str. Delta H]MDI6818192.1 LSM domain-containing protein [Methanothermobacter thermautotrophicus]NLU04195.1 LSM domain protein [Methanothermobacter sp.]REE26491.1 LSM domain-containing protein [Methanothermobacter defluvii]